MYKILILAYLIGQDPAMTMKTFQMEKTFDTMEECKNELLLKDPVRDTYDVMWEFVNDMNFKYDWLAAGCQNEDATEEFVIEPSYPKGKPEELQGIEIIPGLKV
jgi:hypothetical protein